jgi:hypothetical protein
LGNPNLSPVDSESLCVTNGALSTLSDGRLSIETPSSRAFLRLQTIQVAEIDFQYLGPSKDSKPLASGEMRRQVGLKLLAQNTCNLLYVMWHIEPDSKVAVSVKRNPGLTTHEQCDAHGYSNLKAKASLSLAPIAPGESHSLRAELRKRELTVVADGKVAWEGSVPGVDGLGGPVGFRTDNARIVFRYRAGMSLPGGARMACQASPGD